MRLRFCFLVCGILLSAVHWPVPYRPPLAYQEAGATQPPFESGPIHRNEPYVLRTQSQLLPRTVWFVPFEIKMRRPPSYRRVQLVGLFDEVDDDHDGNLHYTEFLAATLETDGKEVTDDMLAEAFDQLDMDDSGFISTENLQEFLGKESKVRASCALAHPLSWL